MSPQVEEYFKFTCEYINIYGPKTIVLYLSGDWYEVYAVVDSDGNYAVVDTDGSYLPSCIQEVHHYLNADISVPKEEGVSGAHTYMGKQVVRTGVRQTFIHQTVRSLIAAGYTVPRIDQYPRVINGNPVLKNGKQVFDRRMSHVYTAGTYDDKESVKLTNNIGCYWFHYESKDNICKKEMLYSGMCILDSYTGTIRSQEIDVEVTQDSGCFDSIGGFHEIQNPSEVIVISNMPDGLYDIMSRHVFNNSVKILKIDLNKKGDLQSKVKYILKLDVQKQFIQQYYAHKYHKALHDMFMEYRYSSYALCYLLDYVKLCNPDIVDMLHVPTYDRQKSYMRTGNHSLVQLNIISVGEENSMLLFLNKCITSIGRREFSRHLLFPITNKHVLQSRYDIIDYIQENWETIKPIRAELGKIHDIERLRRYIIQKQIAPTQVIRILSNCKTISKVYQTLQKHPTLQSYLTTHTIQKHCDDFKLEIEKIFDITVSMDVTKQHYQKCFILKNVDQKLDNYMENSMDSVVILEAIKDNLNKYLVFGGRKSGLIKIDEPKTKARSLILTDASAIILRKKIPDTTISIKYQSRYSDSNKVYNLDCSKLHIEKSSTKKGYHVIVSDSIIECSELIQDSNRKMSIRLEQIYMEWLQKMKETQCDALMNIIQYITELDIMITNAYVAKKYNYCKPTLEMHDDSISFFDAKGMRHPLIEQMNAEELYVPNDVSLGKDPIGILLYGTNAVGKTSLIRAIGISLTMAQCGMYVPCSSFNYAPYHTIYTRILGNDNIFKGMSTFDVEMSELLKIIVNGDKHSLILGDEICSGTETISATSIITSTIQWLYNKSMSFMFATHFHEISAREEITSLSKLALKHMTIRYDKQSGKLVYGRKLQKGSGKSLYGLEVCKSLGFPNEMIENAQLLRNKYNPNTAEHSILSLVKGSSYSSQKTRIFCESCKTKVAIDMDHIREQSESNKDGFIEGFHKNHPANLQALCKACHDKKTKNAKKGVKVKRTKTLDPTNYVITQNDDTPQNQAYPN
jgi:DNA mismatch repair protein MutS